MAIAPITVFYADRVYSRLPTMSRSERLELPEDAILYFATDTLHVHWYRKDLTPMLLEDVPKALRAWVLVLQ
jgi:hypothetical protein